MSISQDVQSLQPGAIVSLFTLDTQINGGGVFYFSPAAQGSSILTFNGIAYPPVPISADGFEVNGSGQLPRPKIQIANVRGIAASILSSDGDILDATVTRLTTFFKYLDGQSEADPTMFFPLDVYRVERKTAHNKVFIEWELSAAMDVDGTSLPGRQALKDNCLARYRYWDATAGAFDYTSADCEYTGTNCFDANDNACTNSLDSCSRHLSGCLARFGKSAVLPFWGFPGLSRS